MEARSSSGRGNRDASLPLSSLRLLVPPLRLFSAAMWQVVQQRDIMHYGKLEEFVTLVTEAVPELLSYRQRSHLILALRARSSDVKVEASEADFVELVQTLLKDPAEREHFLQLGPSYDSALQMLVWEFLSRLEQLLPVPDLKQTVSWLSAAPSVLEDGVQSVSDPQQLKTLLQHHRCLGHLDRNGEEMTDILMDSRDYTGVELGSGLDRSEDIEERMERKTGYGMSREEIDILSNIKEEEEEVMKEGSLRQKEQVMTQKEEMIDSLENPLKKPPDSSEPE
ncbi:hypothetical protein MATL_G00021410 [Megalops atlanticus]|uniref:TERF1-interacting nuclear factor 2 N-terminal domain-containing protein n=1 Tax=Megalops atlanticus TaxID=7932 RepID=A0A9D3QGV1_MEGAT|nr:hypothetical protein MATL_G00021410 [Megalops atlanticus]